MLDEEKLKGFIREFHETYEEWDELASLQGRYTGTELEERQRGVERHIATCKQALACNDFSIVEQDAADALERLCIELSSDTFLHGQLCREILKAKLAVLDKAHRALAGAGEVAGRREPLEVGAHGVLAPAGILSSHFSIVFTGTLHAH